MRPFVAFPPSKPLLDAAAARSTVLRVAGVIGANFDCVLIVEVLCDDFAGGPSMYPPNEKGVRVPPLMPPRESIDLEELGPAP